MTKRDKLRRRIEDNPKNVSFHDLRVLLERYGFELKRTKGSHHSFVAQIGGRKVLLVVPYRKPLQPVYVKQALALIAEIEAEEVEDDGEDEDEDDE
jgi:predicted RNA binding protein YcfA (HicA-like mRNA interferase family)